VEEGKILGKREVERERERVGTRRVVLGGGCHCVELSRCRN